MPSISVPCSQARLHHMIGGSSLTTDHQLLPPALSAIPRLLSNDIYLAYILVKFRLLDLGQNQNDTLAGHRYYLLVATFFFDLCTCCLWVGGLEHLLEYPIISSPNHWVFQAAKKYWEDQRRVSRIVSKNHSWKIKKFDSWGTFLAMRGFFFVGDCACIQAVAMIFSNLAKNSRWGYFGNSWRCSSWYEKALK